MTATPPRRELQLRLLGPLEARRAGEAVPLGGARPRALLADLLVHLGEVVSVDRLVEDVWGTDSPKAAAHAVQVYVSQLRYALDPERTGLIVLRAGGYLVDLDPEALDAVRFERLLDEGRAAHADGDPARSAALLGRALELWRGPPLSDFTYEPFAQSEIARLEELRVLAREERIRADLACGAGAELVGELEALVAEHPFRERLREQLMHALCRAGRQADALAAYRAARETFVEELGVEPDPELRALEQRILNQDEELFAPPPAAAVPRRQTRKLVTVLFADVADSTALSATRDPETVRVALDRYFALAAGVVAEHGGTVEKFIGDAVMAVFGIPISHEDDALRATRAALDLRRRLSELDEGLDRDLGVRLEVRMGLASGEVVAGSTAAGDVSATGEAVIVAARLQQEAAPGEIVLGAPTARLIGHAARLEPLGELALRGRPKPLAAFRLLDLPQAAPAFERRLDAPLVGREGELTRLREAFALAVRERRLVAVSVLGQAGIGKSRLALELRRAVEAVATVLEGRCPSYGEGMTLWPLRTLVRSAAGGESRDEILAVLGAVEAAESVADRLALALGTGPAPADETIWAFRVFCEALAWRRPLVLVLDDLHWAEPLFLDLVQHLAEHSSGAPILLLALARDELREERPDFLERAAELALQALSPAETDALVDALCGETGPAGDTRRRIVEAAEGNPLYLEQLVALAAEEGGFDPGRPLPATIQALLLARLDRLGPGERAVLERAAVVGREFERSAVADLLDPAATATVGRHLEVLVRRGFLRPAAATAAFDDAYRFRHALIQAAVYGATPKVERAELHERVAGRLESAAEEDALIGYHLEQAYRYRAELGPPDRHSRGLAGDAGARLASAGVRSWKSGDARATTNLLGRATSLLPEESANRRELLCELGLAHYSVGDPVRADELLRDVVAAASAEGDLRLERRARFELEFVHLLREPKEAGDRLLALATAAITVLEAVNDDRALGRAWLLTGFVLGGIRCRHEAWADAAERALEHYRRAGWSPAACVGELATALYYGPTAVPVAVARCETLLSDPTIGRGGEANLLAFIGGLEAQAGRFDEARKLVDLAAQIHEELGQRSSAATYSRVVTAEIELLADRPDAAELALRELCELLAEQQNWSALSSRAPALAEALYLQGHYDEAAHWTEVSEAHAARDDLSAQLSWRSVRAKVHARAGRAVEAEALAREALALAARTDGTNWQAATWLDLAEVLALAERGAEAASAVEEARRLYEQKGNLVGAKRTAALATLA